MSLLNLRLKPYIATFLAGSKPFLKLSALVVASLALKLGTDKEISIIKFLLYPKALVIYSFKFTLLGMCS